jgi:hypothetical protein
MIVAMQNFIPDRRATSEKKSPPAPNRAEIYAAAWRRGQQATTPVTTNDTQPSPAPTQQEDSPGAPKPGSAAEAPPDPGPGQSTFAKPLFGSVPDLRVGFSIKNPFVHPR